MNATPVPVRLNYAEAISAAMCGILRRVHSAYAGRCQTYGAGRADGWDRDVCGAIGEYVAAKYCGSLWLGPATVGVTTSPDLLHGGQVRCTAHDTGRLILHDDDPDDAPFILVTGVIPALTLRGWIYGRDGKRAEYWTDPIGGRPAFFVPQSALSDMSTFPRNGAACKS